MQLGPIKPPEEPERRALWDYTFKLNDWMLTEEIISQRAHDGIIEVASYDGITEPFSALCGELEDARIQLSPEQLEELQTFGVQLDPEGVQDVLDVQETH